MSTYNRKYYLHRKLKTQGFALKLEQTQKTINVNHDQVADLQQNKCLVELKEKHSYGVQFINPLMQ